MLRAIAALKRLTPATAGELARDDDRLMLLVHYLEILGEAANGVSEATQQMVPGIPWAAMASARNRLTHGYFDVDADAVFETVSRDVPPLFDALSTLHATVQGQERRID